MAPLSPGSPTAADPEDGAPATAEPKSAPAIAAVGVRKAYGGVVALDGVDFAAAPGEVHALLGENGAGKSTLIKVLTGAVHPDEGEIRRDGAVVALRSHRDAQRLQIGAVFQELSLVRDLTVAQNIWFGREVRTPLGTIARRRMGPDTRALLTRLGIDGLDPGARVGDLPLAQRQLAEIARTAARGPRVLILDEPTSSLSPREVSWLLTLARRMADEGVCVIFISHRMTEVRRVADRVTIFRNGRHVATHAMDEVDDDEIVNEMLGRKPARLYPERVASTATTTALAVRELSDGHRLRGASFEVRTGEVLGIGGLQGQGQTELLLGLYGAIHTTGDIVIDGQPRRIDSPRAALAAGVGLALVPEDRQHEGLLQTKSIRDNIVLPVLGRVTRAGFLQGAAEDRLVAQGTERLNLVATGLDQAAGSLSGGNQQKVVIAKVLLTEARILLLHDLVRGVDVGTKAEVFQLIRNLAAEGYTVLFYSTDLQELINVSDRVLVMADGAVAASLDGDELTEENVLRAAIGSGASSAVAEPGDDREAVPSRESAPGAAARLLASLRRANVLPFVLLAALVALYASRQSGVLSLDQLNLTSAATTTLILVAVGQTIVVLAGGFDLSVGGVVSLATVVAATRFESGPVIVWVMAILIGGLVLGALNGVLISALRMDPFIVTLATWSMWSGASLLILETTGGVIPDSFVNFGTGEFAGLAPAVLLVAALVIFWAVFTRTRSGTRVAAIGSDRLAAYLSGVSVGRTTILAYALSGFFAALAGLYLTTQTASGSPTAGDEFILTSVAAVVIGGTSLAGGRASLGGTMAAAFTLTLIGNVVFSFGLAAGWQIALSGGLLVFAVLVNSLTAVAGRRRGSRTRRVR
jgi:ribose transport system ATP-binding protein